ncbi:hypothetical protein GLUCOINTEAF2_0202632 [Komagataeibacter intermedius AF2]|uniref:CHAT domain-containing protein n=1 Tax=Komagataeibacter intermedius AF2 TaxID=1458464 RepID=A0A0N1F9D8_9PROT|nr:CHAT domain-containing protein [Komagataeibacter intermedius]KPH86581.1 hypothetical protein GLUCOINTEAF2_0202632 [Komagataeibacter intermedius AF2]
MRRQPFFPPLVLCGLLGLAVGGCTRPPQSAYDTAATEDVDIHMQPVGHDSTGIACAMQPHGSMRDLYCGDRNEPSAHITREPVQKGAATASPDAELAALATTSRWRAGLDTAYGCAAPRPLSPRTGGPHGLVLACRQIQGGWPYVGMVQLRGGMAYYADGVPTALPAMLGAMGVLAGAGHPDGTQAAVDPAMDSRLADMLALRAFSTGDRREYARLMAVGARANQAEDFAAAIVAYRAALALQQRLLGVDEPGTLGAMLALALNLSNQGMYAEAEQQFAAAERLIVRSDDPLAPATLLYDRALDSMNHARPDAAIPLLRQALARYENLLPQGGLAGGGLAGAEGPGTQFSLSDPLTRTALLGVVETWRHLALALFHTGDTRGGNAAIARANAVAGRADMASPTMTGRLHRTWGALASADNRHALAARELGLAQQGFDTGMPLSRPMAETILLRAAAQHESGQQAAARESCRHAMTLLRALGRGAAAELLGPCLDIYAVAADQNPAMRETLHAEMFEASQWIQGSVTARQIALAAARLSASAGNPKLAAAIRAQQDARQNLEALYHQRDQMAEQARQATGNTALAALDGQIATAGAAMQQAAMAVQALVPRSEQLLQQAVPASRVLDSLRADEAFVGITGTPRHTWLFVLHAGHVTVARSPLGDGDMAVLVQAVRTSLTPGVDGLPPFAMTQAAAIHAATLGRVASALKGVEELVIAPSGALLALPFALLPTGPANASDPARAPWLIRQASLAYVPTASNFVALRQAQTTAAPRRPWFGLGDFQPATLAQAAASFPTASCHASAAAFASLPALPYARLELQAAAATFGATAGDQLLGARYTASNVRHAALGNYRIVHFATHALLPTDLPCLTEPVIVASTPPTALDLGESLLGADMIGALHLNADLVVLSACNTQGGAQGGEALSALARNFFYAGARAVMVTQWSVNDQASAYLVASSLSRIHAERTGGAAASLRAAQMAMLDDAQAAGTGPSGLGNPFFWAPFVVIGDGGKAAPSTTNPPNL